VASNDRDHGAAPGATGRPPEDLTDHELVEAVRAAPEGPCTTVLQARVYLYAYEVLMGWARSGQLRKQAAKAVDGRGVLGIDRVPVELDASVVEAEMVVVDMFVMAMRGFWGKPFDRWDGASGSSITTYFVTYCLMQLPGAYDKFFRREVKPLLAFVSTELATEQLADADPGPEQIAELRDQITDLAKRDRRLQRMLLLRLDGSTHREIAERMSEEGPLTTEGQVRGELNRLARRARDQGDRRDDLT
jgi:hypothetical protein